VAAAIGLAGASTLTPTASAATDGTTFAAIAYSETTGKDIVVWDAPTQIKADNDAIAKCNTDGGTTDCLLAAYGNYCVSLATDPNPNNNAPYAGGHGVTLQAADQMALAAGQPGFTIQDHRCNDNDTS
jgi:hypothetical protein